MDINYPSGFSDLPTALVSHVSAFSMVKCRVAAAVGSFSILFLTTRGAVAPKEVIVISSITNDGLSSK